MFVKERCWNRKCIEKHYPETLKKFFESHKYEFEKICDAYSMINGLEKSDNIQKFITLGKSLEEAYKDETKAENRKRFLCIRRENIPACDFLTLYEHSFEDELAIEDINNILFHPLTLKKGYGGYIRLASGAPVLFPGWNAKDPQNYYWVGTKGELLTKTTGDEAIDTDETEDEECSSLPSFHD